MDDETGADQDHPLRVQLDLDLDRQPVSGRLRSEWAGTNGSWAGSASPAR